jgi:hypothetical protein
MEEGFNESIAPPARCYGVACPISLDIDKSKAVDDLFGYSL